ncbi:MAG: DeoR/GlpR family DNA-binding transcription regulator [Luteolibacter sp.]
MLALQRQQRIRQLLAGEGTVRTVDLARDLRVSEETVRRDFEKLEQEGVLVRTHGGASKIDLNRRDFPFRERVEQNAAGKLRIARKALEQVKPGATLFFDASTSVLQLATILPEIPLRLVTNGLQTACALSERSTFEVSVLGGGLSAMSLSCTGWSAEWGLLRQRIDLAFISCRGLDPNRGISEAVEENARLKSKVIEHAARTILLADHSKVGVTSNFFLAEDAEIDLWITDQPLPREWLKSDCVLGKRVEVAG